MQTNFCEFKKKNSKVIQAQIWEVNCFGHLHWAFQGCSWTLLAMSVFSKLLAVLIFLAEKA